jgi:hypothetical protein
LIVPGLRFAPSGLLTPSMIEPKTSPTAGSGVTRWCSAECWTRCTACLGRISRREKAIFLRHCERSEAIQLPVKCSGLLRRGARHRAGPGSPSRERDGTPDCRPDLLAPRNDGGESRCDGAYCGFEPSGMPLRPTLSPLCVERGRPHRIRRLFKRFARSYVKEGIAEAFLPCRRATR